MFSQGKLVHLWVHGMQRENIVKMQEKGVLPYLNGCAYKDCKFVHINQSFIFDERKNTREGKVQSL